MSQGISQDISYSLVVFSTGSESRTEVEMEGGRIRGKGTYGCVFQPRLKCRGKKKRNDPSLVGKITSSLDARNELEISEYLHGIEEFDKYTVLPDLESCRPRARSQQSEKDLKMCDFAEDKPLESMIQITMPWGGIPLGQLNLHPTEFDFFRFVEDILAAGTFLVLNDVCHMDIWGQNILFTKDNTPRLIDFGFAFRPSKLRLSDLKNRWREISVDHDTETPEVTLMLGAFNGISHSSLIYQLQESKPVVQRLATLCGVIPRDWSSQITQWAEDSQSFQQKDWTNCWKLYWPGFDAWGIGAVILQILEVQMSFPEFIHSEDWKTRGPTLQMVLRGMCRGHPGYRLDAAEALDILTKGEHSLISAGSAGSDWVQEKVRQRRLL
jgi:serine/threonine protein kinase